MKWGNITNKNVIHPLPRDLWPPNVTGWLRRHIPQSLLPIQSPGFCKSKKLYFHIYKGLWLPHLIGWWLRGKRLQPTKSHESIIKWPCAITWRIKRLNMYNLTSPMDTKLDRMTATCKMGQPIKKSYHPQQKVLSIYVFFHSYIFLPW